MWVPHIQGAPGERIRALPSEQGNGERGGQDGEGVDPTALDRHLRVWSAGECGLRYDVVRGAAETIG